MLWIVQRGISFAEKRFFSPFTCMVDVLGWLSMAPRSCRGRSQTRSYRGAFPRTTRGGKDMLPYRLT